MAEVVCNCCRLELQGAVNGACGWRGARAMTRSGTAGEDERVRRATEAPWGLPVLLAAFLPQPLTCSAPTSAGYTLPLGLADPLTMGVNTFSAAVHIEPGKPELPSVASVWSNLNHSCRQNTRQAWPHQGSQVQGWRARGSHGRYILRRVRHPHTPVFITTCIKGHP